MRTVIANPPPNELRIVIVSGGPRGLELVTRLWDALGSKGHNVPPDLVPVESGDGR